MQTPEQIITQLDLTPHPSGCSGWFRQSFSSPTTVQTLAGERAASTTIYFLQKFGQQSAFHRPTSAELLHFYHGVPLALYWIDQKGKMHKTVLGMELNKGERPQVSIWLFIKSWHAWLLVGYSSGLLVCSENWKWCSWWLLPDWSYGVPRMAPGWHELPLMSLSGCIHDMRTLLETLPDHGIWKDLTIWVSVSMVSIWIFYWLKMIHLWFTHLLGLQHSIILVQQGFHCCHLGEHFLSRVSYASREPYTNWYYSKIILYCTSMSMLVCGLTNRIVLIKH
jgi:predicted cupin superfamily sugar epimerase